MRPKDDVSTEYLVIPNYWYVGPWRIAGRQTSIPESEAADHALPILFLHGIPTYSFLWRSVLAGLAPGRNCLAPDLLGFGFSDKPDTVPYCVPSQADIVESLVEQWIGNDEPFAIVAHDFGGLVAAEILRRKRHPVSQLILTNTSLRASGWRTGFPLSILKQPLVGKLAMSLAQRWMLKLAMVPYFSDRSALTDEVVDGYWAPFRINFRQTVLRLFQESVATRNDFDEWRKALAEFHGGALVAWGMQDPTFGRDYDDVCSLLPENESIPFQHANHFIPEERPLALARLIQRRTTL